MYCVHCLDCHASILLGPDVEVGRKLVCWHCDAELTVKGTVPPEVDWGYTWRYEDDERGGRRQIWLPRLWALLATVVRRCRFPNILPNAKPDSGIPGPDRSMSLRMEESEL